MTLGVSAACEALCRDDAAVSGNLVQRMFLSESTRARRT